MEFTHFNEEKRARMVDVSAKMSTLRMAKASAIVKMKKETIEKIIKGKMKKGDVLAVAQVAGIMAAKRNFELIPMCHNIPLESVDISFKIDEENTKIDIVSEVKTHYITGVEMEALCAVSVAALTIYDMCKAIDRAMVIEKICLLEKKGGKSDYARL